MPGTPADAIPPLDHDNYNPFWVAIAMQMVIGVAETVRDFPGPFTRDVIEGLDRLYTAMPDDARVCLMYALLKRGCDQDAWRRRHADHALTERPSPCMGSSGARALHRRGEVETGA